LVKAQQDAFASMISAANPTATGIVIADAAADFARVRRRQTWSRLARKLQLCPDHASELLAFD